MTGERVCPSPAAGQARREQAEWLASRAVSGTRLALVAPTLQKVREVIIENPKSLRAAAGNPTS